jgi:hypothetical protein
LILENGIVGPSYWGDGFLAQEVAEERASVLGGEPIVFAVALHRFDQALLETNDIGEGTASVASRKNAQKLAAVDDRSWQASFEITGSVVYRGDILVSDYDPDADNEPDPFIFR